MTTAHAYGPGCHMKFDDCPPPPSALSLLLVVLAVVAISYAFYRFVGWTLK